MTTRKRGSRAVRSGPARRAQGVTVEPRDVGEDRGERAVEAARVSHGRVGLRDQRLAQNKRATANARRTHERTLTDHLVSAHGAVRVPGTRTAEPFLRMPDDREVSLWLYDLEREHEALHGRSAR